MTSIIATWNWKCFSSTKLPSSPIFIMKAEAFLLFGLLFYTYILGARAPDPDSKGLIEDDTGNQATNNLVLDVAEKVAGSANKRDTDEGTSKVDTYSLNCTSTNGSDCSQNSKQNLYNLKKMFQDNRDMLMRTLYVLIGVTAVLVLYFAIRTVRVRRRQSKTKKYGVLSSDMEMAPLEEDDNEDEDMTVFEINGLHHK